ncbi:hypothetical protein ACTHOQ_00115 [Solibacillus silvestris]|uniref:hypothetical protein n=1 Tax=Solibacillus silvestris TaxID=76853 RepID=UPI003F805599
MITYETTCFCCKKPFLLKEGTKKYQKFKRNMRGKFSCDACDDKIYMEARKHLLGKLQ